MLVSCITFTNGSTPNQVIQAIEDFDTQTYAERQLIIINNYPTLDECQEIELLFRHKVVIIDRPGFTNGQAIQTAIQYSAGQVVAAYPLNYRHNANRLEISIAALNECEGIFIAPVKKPEGNIIRKNTDLSQLIPELGVYKSPAYTTNYDINYGVWWQYPMMLEEQGLELHEMHTQLASGPHE